MSPTSYQTAPPRVVDIGLLARPECETGAVVATDPASVDVDYDNGVRVHGSARFRRRDERATRRVDALDHEHAAAALRFLLL